MIYENIQTNAQLHKNMKDQLVVEKLQRFLNDVEYN